VNPYQSTTFQRKSNPIADQTITTGMRTRETIEISASPEAVWAAVADPELMPLWNPKCKSCDMISTGAVRQDFQWYCTFQLSGPPHKVRAHVADFIRHEKFVIRYTEVPGYKGHVDESFLLQHHLGKTKLTHEVDMSNIRLPLWLMALMWFFHTFGYRVGKETVDRIEELVEEQGISKE
jgi:uncharacterized protein YndB with AHSA1/START domain